MSLEWEQVVVHALEPEALGRWWADALGWVVVHASAEEFEIRPAPDRLPGLDFVLAERGVGQSKSRLHVDFRPDDRDAEVARLEAHGARRVDIGQGEPSWVVLADPEGNEFCVLGQRSSDPEPVARDLLQQLQDTVAAKDLAAVMEVFDDEVVVFGTAAENVGRAQVEAYLARVLAVDGTLRWTFDQVLPLVDATDVLVFAVTGTVGFDDALGEPLEERAAFRLSCAAVRSGGRWRLRHFHGSVPQTG